jgi:hypothetical protein
VEKGKRGRELHNTKGGLAMIAEVHGSVYFAHGLILGGILVAFAMFIGRK